MCYGLTHWGRVTHICVGKLIIIGSDNGLSPGRRQAIIWTNAGILLIGPLRTNFSEISIEIRTFSFKKIHLKVSSGKWCPFCLGLNVLSWLIVLMWIPQNTFDDKSTLVRAMAWYHWHWSMSSYGITRSQWVHQNTVNGSNRGNFTENKSNISRRNFIWNGIFKILVNLPRANELMRWVLDNKLVCTITSVVHSTLTLQMSCVYIVLHKYRHNGLIMLFMFNMIWTMHPCWSHSANTLSCYSFDCHLFQDRLPVDRICWYPDFK